MTLQGNPHELRLTKGYESTQKAVIPAVFKRESILLKMDTSLSGYGQRESHVIFIVLLGEVMKRFYRSYK